MTEFNLLSVQSASEIVGHALKVNLTSERPHFHYKLGNRFITGTRLSNGKLNLSLDNMAKIYGVVDSVATLHILNHLKLSDKKHTVLSPISVTKNNDAYVLNFENYYFNTFESEAKAIDIMNNIIEKHIAIDFNLKIDKSN